MGGADACGKGPCNSATTNLLPISEENVTASATKAVGSGWKNLALIEALSPDTCEWEHSFPLPFCSDLSDALV